MPKDKTVIEGEPGEWECAQCSNTVQFEDGCDMPRHLRCCGCASVALDDVIAERNALNASLEERRRQVELLAYELRKWQTGEYVDTRLEAERDALKQRICELEKEVLTESERRRKAITERDREREISYATQSRLNAALSGI